jgi:HK97 gp10 family phage protein
MKSGSKVKLTGMKELEDAFADLKKSTARGVLVKSLKPRADKMRDAMKDGAPIDQGALRDSIISGSKVPAKVNPGKAAYAKAMKESGGDKRSAGKAARDANKANPTHFAKVFVGVAGRRRTGIAHLIEWGTSTTPGTGFARKAWDANSAQLLDGLADDIKANLEKAKARAARKAERAKARAGIR